MADRADAAEALNGDRRLPEGAPFDEDLEAAELDDVQANLMDPVLRVEKDRHLAVALDPRDGLDGDSAQLVRRLGGFKVEHDASPQS